jgi:ParB family chromosome partitioning protein
MSKKALGKGISALISGDQEENRESSRIAEVELSALSPNPHQPRHDFSESSLAELSDSIKQKGVLQPILVEAGRDGSYTIIAGERRVRAAKMAGLRKVPVIVRQFNAQEKLEIALIENIQREDLTPIEEAQAYKRLMESAGLSQEDVATQVGKDRSTIANSLRLLKLPADMQEALDSGEMSPGHARAILMAVNPSDQGLLFRRVIETGISVREAEQMAADLNRGKKISGKASKGRPQAGDERREPEIRELEQGLIEKLGTKVSIKGTSAKGRIEIEYYSSDDLERVFDIIQGQKK